MRARTETKEAGEEDVLRRFHPAVAEWFRSAFPSPTKAQELAWPSILDGESTLVLAPTGSGKTLCAFLAAIERLMLSHPGPVQSRCRVLYVSPLKALAVDVERNLQSPLAGIAERARLLGESVHLPAVAVRSGDTPAEERTRMARVPPDILITTPESLFLLLTSKARSILAPVQVVIIDEIHALVPTKRGAHLALSLERLEELAGRRLQRIGLSATQRPLETVARFLGGGIPGRTWKQRPVRIVDAGSRKEYDLKVEVPVEDMARLPGFHSGGETTAPVRERSIWPAVHPRLVELIRAHRSTVLFVNSRRLAERLAAALNEHAGEELARAHHGSVAREERQLIEGMLKAGNLPALVATSTLELGIDMGAVDLVIQIETPPSIASGIQRIGRASHQAGAVSKGLLFPKYRGDLLSTAAITSAILRGAVEPVRMPANPLDVLAQQLVSTVIARECTVEELFDLTRRAAPYASLSRGAFEGTLDMLSGKYPSDRFAELRPRLTWDRARGVVRAREGARALAVANAGTIPDRGLYGVFLADSGTPDEKAHRGGRRVGELDEEMVFESRIGDVFVLGASSWRILEITRDRVLVAPAPGEPGRMPFWKADRPPRPAELGEAIGALTRELLAASPDKARRRLVADHCLDEGAAANLLAYLREQKAATGVVPDDRHIVVERFRDEMGDWRICILSPIGGRLHAPWTLAIEAHLARRGEPEFETLWSDDGIVLRLPDRDRPLPADDLFPGPDEIEDLVVGRLGSSALFAASFREASARALLLPRRRPGLRTPLWIQRKRSHDLLQIAARFRSFPIVLEAFRECLSDVFDLPALVELARRVRRGDVRMVTVDTQTPSPFSSSLLFGYVANYIYDGDAPLAERRAHALAIDQRQLRELLGEAELRDLLDPAAIDAIESALQGLDECRRVSSEDRLHDLLLRLGDLTPGELALRVAGAEPAASTLVDALVRQGRAIRLSIAGEERVVAAEEAGRFRDALGISLPDGLPPSFLEPSMDSRLELIARYARNHGPFRAEDPAKRYRRPIPETIGILRRLADSGRILEGEFRPGQHGREWCDPDVLGALRRKSLAAFRRQVEPAPADALARFLLQWHGICDATGAPAGQGRADAILDAVERLQGAAIPASILESDILPARVPDYRPEDLDLLLASGEILWAGVSPLGSGDGRIALHLADDFPLRIQDSPEAPASDIHESVRKALAGRGAMFFPDILAAVGGGLPRTALDALWDLVWAGIVTNDTFSPLRSLLGHKPRTHRRPRPTALFRTRRQADPSSAGRWSLIAVPQPDGSSPTQRAAKLASLLLSRHGILTRDVVAAEGIPGGFLGMYQFLVELENRGKIRRGYFVAGLGGSQFAAPAALELLRSSLEPERTAQQAAVVLAAADPANPYGAALPWPRGEIRLARVAGSHVVIAKGKLAAYISRDRRELRVFLPDAEPERAALGRLTAAALAAWMKRTGRSSLGWEPEGEIPSSRGPIAPFLIEAGFYASGPGFVLH